MHTYHARPDGGHAMSYVVLSAVLVAGTVVVLSKGNRRVLVVMLAAGLILGYSVASIGDDQPIAPPAPMAGEPR